MRRPIILLAMAMGLMLVEASTSIGQSSATPARGPLARWLRRDLVPVAPTLRVAPTTSLTQTNAKADRAVRPTQAETLPEATPSPPASALPAVAEADPGNQSLSLQAALYGAITSNPDLVSLRQGTANGPSPEAVEVARRFPTTLNPTVWIDYRPITLIPQDTFGNGSSGNASNGTGATANTNHRGFYHSGQNYILFSVRQPLELGHQTTHRYHIARAALDQQQWTLMQAELTALVQTYRLYQTAAYRREKRRVARDLADFNDRLLESIQRRAEANQAAPADAILARVEGRASRQLVQAAQQDYTVALADLRAQIGRPASQGVAAEPLGEFTLPPYIPPVDEQAMTQTALANRPDIHAAQALVRGADAAVRLAKGDRIPTPVVGPQYAMDEAGIQYIGLVYVSAIPVVNNGKPLVIQRQAEAARACLALRQAQERAIAQVRAAVAKWNGATTLVNDAAGLAGELGGEVGKLERLFEEGQADLTKLQQARQRLIQLENARLDATWQATQAQADLLLALGTPTLINAMLARAESDAGARLPNSAATRLSDGPTR